MPVGRQIIRRPRRVLYPDEAGPADDGARMFGEEEYDGTEFGDGKPMATCLGHPPPSHTRATRPVSTMRRRPRDDVGGLLPGSLPHESRIPCRATLFPCRPQD